MSTGSGMPVTKIMVSGCTANFKPQFLSNQYDFWYVAFFYIFVQHYFVYSETKDIAIKSTHYTMHCMYTFWHG